MIDRPEKWRVQDQGFATFLFSTVGKEGGEREAKKERQGVKKQENRRQREKERRRDTAEEKDRQRGRSTQNTG